MNHALKLSAYWMILLWGGILCLDIVLAQLPKLFLHDSIGYGDSYIFQSVENLRRTGVLYPPLDQQHLVPTLYSPFLYWMHALAWAVIPAANPYIGPRLLELVWFVLCLAMAALLARRFVGRQGAFFLGLLLAASFSMVTFWVLQLRSDFPGLACSLFAVYLLMSRKPSHILWAGVFAGLATQFKITFLAAAAAGFLWLLLYRRWRDLVGFSAMTVTFSAGLYVLIGQVEPQMFRNILVLTKAIPDRAAVVVFIRQVLAEPVFLLAMAAFLPLLIPILSRRRPRGLLLALYLAASFAIAVVTSIQAGASVNYFYELLFASVPFAVLGLMRLRAGRAGGVSVYLSLLLLVVFIGPQLIRTARGARYARRQVAQRNSDYDALRQALDGLKVLSSIPDVTVLRPERVITDPILLNYLVLTTGKDLSPLEGRIRGDDFDLVVTQPGDYSWRGVPVLARGLHDAIMDAYRPHCVFQDWLFHLPRNRDSESVKANLERIGCEVQVCAAGAKCPGLGVKQEQFQPTF